MAGSNMVARFFVIVSIKTLLLFKSILMRLNWCWWNFLNNFLNKLQYMRREKNIVVFFFYMNILTSDTGFNTCFIEPNYVFQCWAKASPFNTHNYQFGATSGQFLTNASKSSRYVLFDLPRCRLAHLPRFNSRIVFNVLITLQRFKSTITGWWCPYKQIVSFKKSV